MTTGIHSPYHERLEREERNRAASIALTIGQLEAKARQVGMTNDIRQKIDALEQIRGEHERNADENRSVLNGDGIAASNERKRLKAELNASTSEVIRDRIKDARDGAVDNAIQRLAAGDGGYMAEADWTAFLKTTRSLANLDQLHESLGQVQQRYATSAQVLREPGPYEQDSPNSWVMDSLAVAGRDSNDPAAEARLCRHSQDVVREIRVASAYGQTAEKMILGLYRSIDSHDDERRAREELRTLTAGGGMTAAAASGGAAFVQPAFLMSQWAAYRSPYRAFADQCQPVTLPSYGLNLYLPVFATGTSVTTESEGNATADNDPSAVLAASPIVEKTGQVTLTQQFWDRIGVGIAADVLLFAQLKEQMDAQVDNFAVTQAIAASQTVLNTGTFALATASGEGGFLKDLKAAKSKMTDTSGVRLRATHLFAASDFADYLAALANADGLPIFQPTLNVDGLDPHAQGDPMAEGFTGYTIAGLAMYADDNIPTSGSNLQLVVARPSTVLLAEGAPMPFMFSEGAGSLTSGGGSWSVTNPGGLLERVVGIKQYVACIARFPSGVSTISGAAYSSTTFA